MENEIVERLREGFPCLEWGSDYTCRVRDAASGCLCATAADHITALRAEVERLKAALEEMVNEAAEHHAENVSRAELGGSDMAQRKAKAVVARSGVLFHNIKTIARAALEPLTKEPKA